MNIEREALSERIAAWVREHEAEAVELVGRLVRTESENHPPHGHEAACQDIVAEWLKSAGGEVEMYDIRETPGLEGHPAYMSGRSYERRPNVFAAFRGSGDGRSLLFSGHIDTVYQGTEAWSYPPFGAAVSEGRLYGRGSYDMKGGLAAAFMAIKCLRQLGVSLRGDVYAESVVDEEHGGANGSLAGRLRGPHADMAVVPEPSNLKLYRAHLGGGIWKATFKGRSGIAFNGEELVSALDATVDFARLLREYGAYRNRKYPAPALWNGSKQAETVVLSILSGDPARELQEKLPEDGELKFWIEGYPGMKGEQIIDELWAYYETRLDDYPTLRASRPVITPMIRYLEASDMPPIEKCDSFLRIVAEAGQRVQGAPCDAPTGAPFACDGFMFNLHSPTPALVLGPSGGNAHAADEFLDLDSFYTLIRWYAELAVDWCGVESAGVTVR